MKKHDISISEMAGTYHLHPNDIFPLVQQGMNKIITAEALAKELTKFVGCDSRKPHVDFSDPCSCDKALYEARQAHIKAAQALNNAQESLRTAKESLLAATKAYDIVKDEVDPTLKTLTNNVEEI